VTVQLIQSFSKKIYIHEFVNPPNEQGTSDFDISITNTTGRINLIKKAVDIQTEYLLKVTDLPSLGIRTSSDGVVNSLIRDIILSFNLISKHAAFELSKDISNTDLEFEKKKVEVKEEQSSEGHKVIVSIPLELRSSFSWRSNIKEDIDELMVIDTINLIKKVGGTGHYLVKD
jgi:hypothetical protein